MASEEAHTAGLRPGKVTSEEQYVQALRRLRECSGLTFRQIESRSEEGPLVLPASTLATALQRRTMPRPEMVAALVQACGGGPELVDEWLALRETVLYPPAEDGASAREPVSETRERRASWPVVAVLTAVLGMVVTAGVVAFVRSGQDSPAHATSTTPSRTPEKAAAAVALPPGSDIPKIGGLCLSEHKNDPSGTIYLTACAQSFPTHRLMRYGDLWRVTTRHPQYGAGCMGVVSGSTVAGAALSDDACDRIQTDRFILQAVPGGYHLLPENDDLCVGIRGKPAVGAALLQLPCAPGALGQVFTVTPT